MPPKISLIVPVYNVEKYIRECFESVLSQECQDFELIAVDDGSTDSSGGICDEYAARDPRFSAIHTPNRGIGNARNLAMDRMAGEYCFFLDPDDVLEPYSLSLLVRKMEEHGADIVLGVSSNFAGSWAERPGTGSPQTRAAAGRGAGGEARGGKPADQSGGGQEGPDASHWLPGQAKEASYATRKDIIEQVLFDKVDMKPMELKREPPNVNWEFFSALYRTDFLRRHGIRFLDISYGEDTYVALKYLLLAGKAVTLSRTVYWHRRNPTSTSFQYHAGYLEQTRKYYAAYRGLFAELAPDYLARAEDALKANWFRRCVSAIDREFLLAGRFKSLWEIRATLAEIAADPFFLEMYPRGIRFVSGRYTKPFAVLLKHGIVLPAALASKLYALLKG